MYSNIRIEVSFQVLLFIPRRHLATRGEVTPELPEVASLT